jgi:hypothetical protein
MPSKASLESAGHELKVNPPKVLKSTAHKFGKERAEKQRRAIMFSKARRTEGGKY